MSERKTSTINLTPEEIAKLERLQMEGLPKWAKDELKNLSDHRWRLAQALDAAHRHLCESGTIGIPNGDGTYTDIDNGAEYCDSSLYELVEQSLNWRPGEHRWHHRMNLFCCRDCGFVHNGHNKPCPGPVSIGLRDDRATPNSENGHD